MGREGGMGWVRNNDEGGDEVRDWNGDRDEDAKETGKGSRTGIGRERRRGQLRLTGGPGGPGSPRGPCTDWPTPGSPWI